MRSRLKSLAFAFSLILIIVCAGGFSPNMEEPTFKRMTWSCQGVIGYVRVPASWPDFDPEKFFQMRYQIREFPGLCSCDVISVDETEVFMIANDCVTCEVYGAYHEKGTNPPEMWIWEDGKPRRCSWEELGRHLLDASQSRSIKMEV